nr:hypothetical protein [Tanacetum cinerariifolium]
DQPSSCHFFTYANVVNSDQMKTKVNFRLLESDVGNVEANLVIPMASVQEVNASVYIRIERFAGKWAIYDSECPYYFEEMPPDANQTKEDLTKDMLVVAIPKLECSRYSMKIIRMKYEWKPNISDECKVFGHSCDNCAIKRSTSNIKPKDGKQKDIEDDGFQSVKRKTSKDGNWDNQEQCTSKDAPIRSSMEIRAGLGSISPQWSAPIRSLLKIGAGLRCDLLIGFEDGGGRPVLNLPHCHS